MAVAARAAADAEQQWSRSVAEWMARDDVDPVCSANVARGLPSPIKFAAGIP